ncbi:MAG: MFS transporter [Blastocatellia bacterium]|nr:MFS transporter [Blastocatellia bacterium]
MTHIGYLTLLKQNKNYRRLWLGQVVSAIGDWLNAAAMYSLVEKLTGSGRAVAWVLILQFLPFFILSPISGVVADRISRRKIMICADLVRAVVVLGLLFVRQPQDVWLVYGIVAVMDSMTAFFEPARQAMMPSLCRKEELFTANALASLTWSLTLAVGAGLGGLVTLLVGREATFVIDSLSFVLSAWVIRKIQIPAPTVDGVDVRDTTRLGQGLPKPPAPSGWGDLVEGIRYVVQRPAVLALLLVKTAASLGGGFLVLLTLFGQRLFPIGKTGTAVALLYAARGCGTALGPIVARRVAGTGYGALRMGIGWAFLIYGVFYMAFGYAPNLWWAMTALVLAHIGGSIQWVNSTILLQISVPDQYRGRVFAWEWGLLTLAAAISNYVVGWAVDVARIPPRQAATGVGIYLMLPGLAWAILQVLLREDFRRTLQPKD